MRQYLVSGFIQFQVLTDWLPLKATATLEDHEFMDLATIAKIEAQLLHEATANGYGDAFRVRISSFQPVETRAPVRPLRSERPKDITGLVDRALRAEREAGFYVHLNDCGTVLPPVDSKLLIEIAPGVILRAIRPEHAENRGDQLLFNLEGGGQYIGRPRWTHP